MKTPLVCGRGTKEAAVKLPLVGFGCLDTFEIWRQRPRSRSSWFENEIEIERKQINQSKLNQEEAKKLTDRKWQIKLKK